MKRNIAILRDLLARAQAATGPDRELDAGMWEIFTPGCSRKETIVKSSTGLWPDYTIDETRDETNKLIITPSYTSSLDAAVTLIERALPGTEYDISTLHGVAHVELPLNDEYCQSANRKDGNVNLALIEAMLMALIAIEERNAT